MRFVPSQSGDNENNRHLFVSSVVSSSLRPYRMAKHVQELQELFFLPFIHITRGCSTLYMRSAAADYIVRMCVYAQSVPELLLFIYEFFNQFDTNLFVKVIY